MARSKMLQLIIDNMSKEFGISQDFLIASDHPGSCRCEKCLDWWIQMGADEDGKYGPFTAEEILEAKRKK